MSGLPDAASPSAAVSAKKLDRVAAEVLGDLHDRGLYRRMRCLGGAQGPRMRVDGRDVLLFAGSNYLDLAHHPEVVNAAARAARDYGGAAGGSRLINGNLEIHEALENELADFLGTEAALVFNTGYMANVGVLPALAEAGDVIVSDALSHASIIDGCRLSRADVRVVRHGDLEHLDETLGEVTAKYRRVVVALDGVYSMDGDLAPVAEVVGLVERHDAILLLDDAHGTGTLGTKGRGTAELCGVEGHRVDIVLGTLGKALGSFGAFIAGSSALRDLLVNTARSFIFSCALPPAQVAAARAALALVRREPWRRERLQDNARLLRECLVEAGLPAAQSRTHIVPLIVGENGPTMELCERLLERGFFAQGIRYPSVPRGQARLRITPMATHEPREIEALVHAVAEIWMDLNLPMAHVATTPAGARHAV